MWYGWLLTRPLVIARARRAAEAAGEQNLSDDEVVDWCCRKSQRFRYLWRLLDVELRMWMKPFLAYDHGNARLLYAYLPRMILYFIYYTNGARWRSSRIVPWLLSHLAATIYRISKRPDLQRTFARCCKMANDIFIEHLNSVLKRLVPVNTKITAARIKLASCVVSAKWALGNAVKRILGFKHKPPTSELLQDEKRIKSKSFKPTLDMGSKYWWKMFEDEIVNIEAGKPTPCAAALRDKAAIGFAHVPSFSKMYKERLRRATVPKEKTAEARRDEAAEVASARAKYKAELTYDKVQGMSDAAAKWALSAMKVDGRGAVKEGERKGKSLRLEERKELLVEFLGLAPPAPAPAS